MGQAYGTSCWTATWGVLLPKRAPEWFRKRVLGVGSGDVHLPAPPEGSLFLLGFIRFDVPDESVVKSYYVKGIGAGQATQAYAGEVRFNVGPSQIIHRVVPGAEPQGFPGVTTFWLEDIRSVTDGFNVLGRELGLDLVVEMQEALTGGEFSLLIKGPERTNMNIVTEAPEGRPAKIRKIPRPVSLQEQEDPPKTLNAVALLDICFPVQSRDAMLSCLKFYMHYFDARGITPAGPTQYRVCVHFGPDGSLNQTLTFKQDVATASWQNAGCIGIYLRTSKEFTLAFAKCRKGNLLQGPIDSLAKANEQMEFQISGIRDPDTGALIMPLRHVIRHPDHPECPIPAEQKQKVARKD
mmetsp:Transcript_63818/g.118609  ORF Transcript_63818/g.118609 Transcript_63818/m.118609 type:complete len:352 (-) Transcript_63818:39-1094(-)